MGVIMCGMWFLWTGRNDDRRHGKIPIDPGKTLACVIETCYQLISGKQTDSQTNAEAGEALLAAAWGWDGEN